MTHRAPGFSASRRGTIIIPLLVALILLQLVVAGMILGGARDHDLTVQRIDTTRAFYAAEAGANMALRELAYGVDFDGDGVVGSISDDGNHTNNPALNGSRFFVSSQPSGQGALFTVEGSRALTARRIEISTVSSAQPQQESGGWAGLFAEYFNAPNNVSQLSQVNWSASPIAVTVVPQVYFPAQSTSTPRYAGGPTANWAARFTGSINIAQAGLWTFWIDSDGGSRLFINGQEVIENDGAHSMRKRSGSVNLTEGSHDIEIRYFERTGNNGLILTWRGPGVPAETLVPARALRCAPKGVPHLAANSMIRLLGDGSATACSADAFDSSLGPYGAQNNFTDRAFAAVNSAANNAFELTSRSRLYGDAAVGPGGSINSGFSISGNAAVTGGLSVLERRIAITSQAPPPGMPASLGSGQFSGQVGLNSNRRYSSLQISGNNTTVTVVGHITVQIDGAFQMSDSAGIVIAADSSLTLVIGGSAQFAGRSHANANTGIPENLMIFMTGNGNPLTISDRSRLAARVWNPRGSVSITGNGNPGSEFFGTIFCDIFTLNDKCRLRLDDRTGGGQGPGGGLAGFSVGGWNEIGR